MISHGRDAQRRPRRLQPQRLKQLSERIETYRQNLEASYERLENHLQTLHRPRRIPMTKAKLEVIAPANGPVIITHRFIKASPSDPSSGDA